jgi:hypothetical protein
VARREGDEGVSRATDLSLQPVIDFIVEQYAASHLQVPFGVPADQAEAILRELVEISLIVPAHKVEERAGDSCRCSAPDRSPYYHGTRALILGVG